MERALPCALLLLFLLGRTAGESGGQTCRLGTYGVPLPDDPLQCPGRSDGSGESPSDGPQGSPESPGKARAGDSPAKETGRTWPPISGASAEEVSRSPTGPKAARVFLMDGEQCHRWVFGQTSPVDTFQCPTRHNHPDDLFCCGTCTISYCCSSQKDRQEQASCPKIMEELGDQGAEESTGPPPEKPASISKIALILVLSGVTCLCIWISCICLQFQNRRINRNDQRAGNRQREVIQEVLPEAAVDRPEDEQQREELDELLEEAAVDRPGDEQREVIQELLPEAAVDRPEDEQREESHELLEEAAVDRPASSQVPEESPRSSELPPAVASPPDGSRSPMDEEIPPAVPPEGNLELPPEEEDTAL